MIVPIGKYRQITLFSNLVWFIGALVPQQQPAGLPGGLFFFGGGGEGLPPKYRGYPKYPLSPFLGPRVIIINLKY